MMVITERELHNTIPFVINETGIVLNYTKEFLIKKCITPIVDSLQISSPKDLMRINQKLKPLGAHIIGSTESIIEIQDLFKRESFHNITYYGKR